VEHVHSGEPGANNQGIKGVRRLAVSGHRIFLLSGGEAPASPVATVLVLEAYRSLPKDHDGPHAELRSGMHYDLTRW
jgi:hypothetical protein